MDHREEVEAVVANEVDGHVGETLEQDTTVGIEQDGSRPGKEFDPLNLLPQPRTKPPRQRRVTFAVVGHDRIEIVFNRGMESQAAICHFQREPIRASSSPQVSPIEGSD